MTFKFLKILHHLSKIYNSHSTPNGVSKIPLISHSILKFILNLNRCNLIYNTKKYLKLLKISVFFSILYIRIYIINISRYHDQTIFLLFQIY